MQIGFDAPTFGSLAEAEALARIITQGEALGFDYVTVSDHIMVPRNLESKYPYNAAGEFGASNIRWLDQLTSTAWLAAQTKRLRFVMSVMVVPYRPAVLTAKILSTIDVLSGGRLTVGIGAGWCAEEFETLNAPPFAERGAVTDEWMEACRELWTAENPKFRGKYVAFDDVSFLPKPLQNPIPVWVGGESGPALRRLAKLADGWYPVGTNPQFLMNTKSRFAAGIARMRAVCEKAGRDSAGIAIALRVLVRPGDRPRATIDGEAEMFTGGGGHWMEDIAALEELGVSALDVRLTGGGIGATLDRMKQFRDDVLARR